MKRMSPLLLALAIGSLSLIPNSSMGAAPAPGDSCLKINSISSYLHLPIKCLKIGKKLKWQKIPPPKLAPIALPSTQPFSQVSPAPTNSLGQEITVVATRWSWQFSYSGKEGSSLLLTDNKEQPALLYLPLGQKVNFILRTGDSAHGLWIPGLSLDIKILPNQKSSLQFTAEKLGSFSGACNVICGREHTSMTFIAKVVTPDQYQLYLNGLTS